MDDEVGVGAGPAERARHAGGDGPAPTRRRRMSAGRKREAVLRLLRGEDLELVSRELRARLHFAGVRTSRHRVLRLVRAHGLLASQRAGRGARRPTTARSRPGGST